MSNPAGPRGLIVAAPASGSGKTVISLGLMRALRHAGLRVAAAKVGPDYIDPAFHAAASGRPSLNLDPWAMRPALLRHLIERLGEDADIVLVEGVMGLFDGVDSSSLGSTAHLAELTGWPVVLIADVRGQAATAAAVIGGLVGYRASTKVAGVIFNRVGGAGHEAVLNDAVRRHAPGVVRLGAIRRDARLELPDRHLGLVQASETEALNQRLDAMAAVIGAAIDLDRLTRLATATQLITDTPGDAAGIPPLGQRIAVARDQAFSFAYPALLDSWRSAGAEICPFSPLAGEAPDAAADAIYLPGGYPELHAGRLAAASAFVGGLAAAARLGITIYGECGGYMVLGERLVDAEGHSHSMAGLLPLATSVAAGGLHLGYRQVRLMARSKLGLAGSTFRGHEFHYARMLQQGDVSPLFDVSNARGEALGPMGLRVGSAMGSFIHLIDTVAT